MLAQAGKGSQEGAIWSAATVAAFEQKDAAAKERGALFSDRLSSKVLKSGDKSPHSKLLH